MKAWKQAFWLAKFELKKSMMAFISLIIVYFLLTLFVIMALPEYLSKGFVGLDLFFLLLFLLTPSWVKPKKFQFQDINNQLTVVPFVFLNNQLPIPKNVIIKSRIIVYFLYSFPIQVISLTFIYSFTSEIHSITTPITYIAFSFIWLAFGIYAGYSVPATDIGIENNKWLGKMQLFWAILFWAVIILFLTFFHLIFKHGLVHWSLILAEKLPIPAIIFSILLGFFGLKYWQHEMKRQLNKLDYF